MPSWGPDFVNKFISILFLYLYNKHHLFVSQLYIMYNNNICSNALLSPTLKNLYIISFFFPLLIVKHPSRFWNWWILNCFWGGFLALKLFLFAILFLYLYNKHHLFVSQLYIKKTDKEKWTHDWQGERVVK
jgi:hypothetical protein